MRFLVKAMLLLAVFGSIIGCSRKNNTFVNRNWHALTAEYNTLYNGRLALEMGKEDISENYFDNYWDILPVERMQLKEEVTLPGYTSNPNFERAEEKAVKAIQRHSMLIDGSEKNPQVDEAYMLLGKARYFDQRFVPALEAFNYVLHRFPLSNSITEARIWREKANIRLEFYEVAMENLKEILEEDELEDQYKANATAMLAQSYISLGILDTAVAYIDTAAVYTKTREDEGRYLFIKGQLYDRMGEYEKATSAYEEVIGLKRKIPRVYHINAHLAKLHNLYDAGAEREVVLKSLEELAQDRENRPYLSRIYFQLGEFHRNQDSTELAIDYYNRSLEQQSEDAVLKSLNYESLGNLFFDQTNYKLAGAYYDSTLTQMAQHTREYRIVQKKRDNLEDVIYYENIASSNDSILYLVGLSEEGRLEHFTEITERLKEDARKALAEAEVGQTDRISSFDRQRQPVLGVPDPSNAFYFYNPTTVSYGKEEFLRLWGNRELTDNWRYGNIGAAPLDTEAVVLNEEVLFENNPVFDPQTYIALIPSDREVIDSLASDRNYAYYQLGLIYGEKFQAEELSVESLEILLENDPEERLVLPAKYQLYKLYNELGDQVAAASVKNDILFQYPDSRQASIIRNPGAALEVENSPDQSYAAVYELFQDQGYEDVIVQSNEMVAAFAGDGIVPKFELLKAMAVGRLMGLEEYREALNYVALTYPQSEEGKRAQVLYSEAIPELAAQQFAADSPQDRYKLVYPLKRAEAGALEELRTQVTDLLEKSGYSHLHLSTDVYSPQELFLVIHGLPTAQEASLLAERVEEKIGQEVNSFFISSNNYSILQIQKNLDTYLNFQSQNP